MLKFSLLARDFNGEDSNADSAICSGDAAEVNKLTKDAAIHHCWKVVPEGIKPKGSSGNWVVEVVSCRLSLLFAIPMPFQQ